MRSGTYFLLLTLTAATTLTAGERRESYVSYDDGDATIIQSSDHRSIGSRVNLPLFAGDEITTGRRGRSELRLSDGNVIALDRNSSLRLRSVAESYDNDARETQASLSGGIAIIHRTYVATTSVRLDSPLASYVGGRDSIYAIETDSRDNDLLSVFEGSVEVRTQGGTDRVRAGEEAKIDHDGVYGTNSRARGGSSDFERWYLRRADRYGQHSSRYLSDRFSYGDSDLDSNGSWVYAGDYGSWVWRPRVTTSWRPYYYGSWIHSPGGSLVWASDESWGWLPYHYGRWAFSPGYGWVWLPGSSYSPAWVYWAYGSDYLGWSPAGWYDCYRPYYDWRYRPYARSGIDVGFGFYGRVHFRDVDLRGWTFANSNALMSTRIDRATMTTDIIRDRLMRSGDLVVSNGANRFTRDQLRNPADAIQSIHRTPSGGGTGKGDSGSLADVTPFFRRDPEIPTAVRDRVNRGLPSPVDAAHLSGASGASGASPSVVDRNGGRLVPGRGASDPGSASGVVTRGGDAGANITRDRGDRSATPPVTRDGDWRNRVTRSPRDSEEGATSGRGAVTTPRDDEWRNRSVVRRGGDDSSGTTSVVPRRGGADSAGTGDEWRRPSARPRDDSGERDQTPRRVIDRINGERGGDPGSRTATPRSERTQPRTIDRPSSDTPRASTPRPESHNNSSEHHDNESHTSIKRQ